jgi:hypothetical protein
MQEESADLLKVTRAVVNQNKFYYLYIHAILTLMYHTPAKRIDKKLHHVLLFTDII